MARAPNPDQLVQREGWAGQEHSGRVHRLLGSTDRSRLREGWGLLEDRLKDKEGLSVSSRLEREQGRLGGTQMELGLSGSKEALAHSASKAGKVLSGGCLGRCRRARGRNTILSSGNNPIPG